MPTTNRALQNRILSALHQFHEGTPGEHAELAQVLADVLVPAGHMLVDFDTVTEHEPGDWEHSLPGYDVSSLSRPRILAHRVTDEVLARLYYEIENNGTLGEHDAYHDLDKLVEQMGEKPAQRARDRAAQERLAPIAFDQSATADQP